MHLLHIACGRRAQDPPRHCRFRRSRAEQRSGAKSHRRIMTSDAITMLAGRAVQQGSQPRSKPWPTTVDVTSPQLVYGLRQIRCDSVSPHHSWLHLAVGLSGDEPPCTHGLLPRCRRAHCPRTAARQRVDGHDDRAIRRGRRADAYPDRGVVPDCLVGRSGQRASGTGRRESATAQAATQPGGPLAALAGACGGGSAQGARPPPCRAGTGSTSAATPGCGPAGTPATWSHGWSGSASA
jgi:hypothetical protein